jgi:UDPglucose 6-dehydrogenase
VQAFDPEGMHEAAKLLSDPTFCEGPYDALAGAHAAVIVTEWDQFRALDLDRIKLTMAQPVMVDLRNVYRADEMRARGFAYSSIGRA